MFPSKLYPLSTVFGVVIMNIQFSGYKGRPIFASCNSFSGVAGDPLTASVISEMLLSLVTLQLRTDVDGGMPVDSVVGFYRVQQIIVFTLGV